ncbi:MAG: ABC transporter permease [Gemmatimonadota bacterium]|nr:MAG: ABC transporter permease [Gemmatimonadota bacterium]
MTQLFEGVGIAIHSLKAAKARAALTILGIAIGVMVVVLMAAFITGVNMGVEDMLNQLGPRTFFVTRTSQTVIFDDSDYYRAPPLTVHEADRIRELPSVSLVVVGEFNSREVEFGNQTLSSVEVRGLSAGWPRVMGGDIYPGRSYTGLESAASSRVVVINQKLSDELFGLQDPLGNRIKVGGVPFTVIGVYQPPPDIFGQGNRPFVTIPQGAFNKYVRTWRADLVFYVAPSAEVTVHQATEDVTAALRSFRGLGPRDDNNFGVVTQEKALEDFNQITGVIFLVMLVLSSVALMVGGVGVVAIMMISVTERTREIGVRKAIGARRREILWQFLVEAATLTLIGGAIGLALGGTASLLLKSLTPLPAEIPLWSVIAALGASIVTGVMFGMYPAAKAARLDPVEALRYE